MAAEPHLTDEQRQAVDAFRKRHRTALLALLFTDVEGSTALKSQMGEAPASTLLERHGALIRELLAEFNDAQEISTAGDSFFVVFVKPSDAVRFALLAQARLRGLAERERAKFRVRIGIHLGEVFVAEDVEAGTVRDVLGMQVDLASRVTSLAAGGQVLMTRGVFDSARQILKGQTLSGIEHLSWLNHGLYLLKGIEEPLEICEVGEPDAASLRQPADCEAGRRAIVPSGEPVLGWRPAVEQAVPNTQWVLERQLGEGGFGEVWLARHSRSKELRVFKFCFRADQLRNLKREMTIFRILKEVLGTREDIARLIDVQFEESPFYLEFEYTPGGSLRELIDSRGGCDKVPMALRLEIVAQTASALAAAHSVGVIHKDVKPSNILVEERRDGSVQARLTDFGIGQLTEHALLGRIGVTQTGFTLTGASSSGPSSHTGTRLYMAPELIAGRPLTIQSDIYSLGVLLYQLIVGDLTQPMTTDWERRVEDPLLREDLRACLAGNPTDRLVGADELARRLRTLDERRVEHARREAAERAQALRRGLTRAAMAGAGLLVIVALALGYGLYRAEKARQLLLVEQERTKRENYYSTIRFAAMSIEESRFDQARELLADCPPRFRAWEWGRLQYLCICGWTALGSHSGGVADIAFSPDGRFLASAGKDWAARLWDVETGREIQTFGEHAGALSSLAFSPGGNFLATASMDGYAMIWDGNSGRLLQRLADYPNRVHVVTFISGSRLATGSSDHRMRVWDPETGQELKTIEVPDWEFLDIEFMPDGKRFVTLGDPGAPDPGMRDVRLLDAETGDLIRVFGGHTKPVESIALSPDGRFLATGSADETVNLWDVETGRVIRTFQGHTGRIMDIAFSPDGRWMATGCADKTARLWDVVTGGLLRTFRGHSDPVTAVALSPDGKYLATGGGREDPTVRLWPLQPTMLSPASAHRPANGAITPSSPSAVLRVPRPDEAEADLWERQASGGIRVFDDYTGEGHGIALGAGGILAMVTGGGTVALVDTDTGRRLLTLRSGALIRSIAASPDGRVLAGGCVGGAIVLWDLETGFPIRTLEHGSGIVYDIAFSPDGARLASAADHREQFVSTIDNAARVWDVRTGNLLATLKGHTDSVVHLAFSPDGSRIATAGNDMTVRLWNTDSGQLLHTFQTDSVAHTVAFGSDGRWILLSTDRSLRILAAQTGEELSTLETQVSPVNDAVFSPDGRRLVTGGNDQAVKVWDMDTRREVLSLLGHEGALCALAFSPDGRQLATADWGGRLIVWTAFPWRLQEYPGDDTMPVEERIARYGRELRDRRFAAAYADPPIAGTRRSFGTSAWTPGVPVEVSLALEWSSDASSVSVREKVPSGWRVQEVSHGGRREEATIVWEVAPWTSAGVTLRYTATPPSGADIAPARFADALAQSDTNHWFQIDDSSLPRAGTRVFQNGAHPGPDYEEGQDAHVIIVWPDYSTGSSRMLEEGARSGAKDSDHKKILVRFDLSSVPSTFSLERAELRLFEFNERLGGLQTSHTLFAARILKAWNEGQSEQRRWWEFDGDPPQPGAATFVSARHGEQPWERPGAVGLTDVADAESSTTAGAGWPGWIAFDVTESVRAFLRDPSSNHGWKISQDSDRGVDDDTIEYVNGIFGYKSSEAPEVHLRPMLILTPSKGRPARFGVATP